MLNRIILIGRLTRDPELRYTPSTNKALATFTIAVDRQFQQADKKEKEADFIRIVCWGKLAELCKEHLGKGRLVAVDGRLQIRSWDSPQGERKSMAEVNAETVKFLDRASGPRPQRNDDGPGPEAYDNDAPRDYGRISDKEIDEEIDLNEDPF